jgi:hypothetical protein
MATCGDLLKKADFSNNEHRQQLRSRVSVSDDYIVLRRILGLYPLTHLFVSHGVSRWHAAAFVGRRHFDDPYYMDRIFGETNSR